MEGTVLGAKFTSSYANIFMSKFEDKYVYPYSDQPLLWKRLIDDIFLIWTHGFDKLDDFITHLNQIHHTLKFTF